MILTGKIKLLAIILVAALIATAAIDVYQYTTNVTVSQQKDELDSLLSMKFTLQSAQYQINGELQSLDEALINACHQLSTTGLTGTNARAILTKLVANNSLIVNAVTADAHDVLLAVEPANYSSIEGQDISDQEQNIQMHKTMQPSMSNMIPLVEGFPGVVMVAPIFDSNNQFIGSLSIVIQPRALIEKYIPSYYLAQTNRSMWSMQLNGTLIYDPDPAQQGKNLLSDEIYQEYPEVQNFAVLVASSQYGYDSYRYFDKNLSDASGKVITKEAFWETIGIYNIQWRLVIVQPSTNPLFEPAY